ncbi:MAG: tRNA uridine-5-carboxymethylaminomethyl(34) synthesis GTPase MnmE, partial [Mailhella sp.]|nr:tRNA uridine-5-carboxymethylaminomethyl(34) synthesis GTPase MnmE [Mailhella sp.]
IPRTLHFGQLLDDTGRAVDEALAVWFQAPRSFTGEDCVELHAHGGLAVLAALLDSALARGARLAERGEFTRRAFLNGKIDLSQAEAVAELIAAPSREGVYLASAKLEGLLGKRIASLRSKLERLRQRVCLAIDFPDEDSISLPAQEFAAAVSMISKDIQSLLAGYERARSWREGSLVVIAGRVNAGKSSLMNALLGRPRAIVTSQPGTTRDYLEEQTHLAGLPVRLVDTAGLRWQTDDPIEKEGIKRGMELAQNARCILLVLDGALSVPGKSPSEIFAEEKELALQFGPTRCIPVWNKSDEEELPPDLEHFFGSQVLPISALHGSGLDELCMEIRRRCLENSGEEEAILAPNLRQANALKLALEDLCLLQKAIEEGMPADICGIHLESAAQRLADVTGLNTTEETLNSIFSSFCIGK